ncbi:SDR family NAD(P)-dependent oxidoreductase [Rhodococcus opacus]|uniref:SDR family NAD(P)-dependent oxidoreductase n=1 Tax=Rhodococcus opacus TaxID=37919 RepID=UPI0029494122|nr:glucose 1-dehydrogenase [Rhodococcus opacus]MDV6247198.1 SDR family oxidoreductase [Rhodococcus opacus]
MSSSSDFPNDAAGRLSGRSIIITGAARGIGLATARFCAAAGARVMLTDVREDELKEVAAAIPGEVTTAVHDIADEESWQRVVTEAEQSIGPVNGLFNNAGIGDLTPLEDTTREWWDKVISVNQTGTWLGIKSVIPAMRRAGGGSIVNASSIYGLVGSGGATVYQVTKGAIRILTKTAAVQYAPEGIRVNSLHPGIVRTPLTDEVIPNEAMDDLVARTPLGRAADPDDIAPYVVFLLSEESRFVTGAECIVDGGFTAI